MWDGKGFNDRVARKNGIYATYKLALAVLAAARLDKQSDALAAVLERLLAQQGRDGGWITDYDKTGKPVGMANVETTSLAILAVEAIEKEQARRSNHGTPAFRADVPGPSPVGHWTATA